MFTSAVSHVHERRELQRVGVVTQDEDTHVGDGIYIDSAAFKLRNQAGRLSHGPRDHDGRGAFLEEPLRPQPLLIFADRGENQVVIHGILHIAVEKQPGFRNARRLRLRDEHSPAAYPAPDISEHVAVICAVAAGKIGVQRRPLQGVHGGDVVRGVGGHRGEHRYSPVGSLLDHGALILGDAHAHAVDEHEVASAYPAELVAVQLAYPYEPAVVSLGDLSERERLVVHEAHPYGRKPCRPYCADGGAGGQHGNGYKYS